MAVHAELDIDVRWAGEPDVLLKLEPSNKWLMNAVKIGEPALDSTPAKTTWLCPICALKERWQPAEPLLSTGPGTGKMPPHRGGCNPGCRIQCPKHDIVTQLQYLPMPPAAASQHAALGTLHICGPRSVPCNKQGHLEHMTVAGVRAAYHWCRKAEGAAVSEHDAGHGCTSAHRADVSCAASQPVACFGRLALHWRGGPVIHDAALP